MDMRHELYGSYDPEGLVESLWTPSLRSTDESFTDASGDVKLSVVAQCYERALPQAQAGDFELGMIAHLERRLIKSLARWAAPLSTELAVVMLPVVAQPEWFSEPRDAAPAQMNRAVRVGADILGLQQYQSGALTSVSLHKASLVYAFQAAWYRQPLHPFTGLKKLDTWLQEAELVAQEFSLPAAKAEERLHRVRTMQSILEDLDSLYGSRYTFERQQKSVFDRSLDEHMTEDEIRDIFR